LDRLSLFIEEFEQFEHHEDVIAVAPDVGLSIFVSHFSRAPGIYSAIASGTWTESEAVITTEIIANVEGKRMAIILDDIISNGLFWPKYKHLQTKKNKTNKIE